MHQATCSDCQAVGVEGNEAAEAAVSNTTDLAGTLLLGKWKESKVFTSDFIVALYSGFISGFYMVS